MSNYIKIFDRIKSVFGNSFALAIPSVSNLLLSLLIIRLYPAEWWGKIVEMQIIYYLAINFTAWGNKEYLLREFSNNSAKIKSIWSGSFNLRFVYVLLPVCIGLIIYDHSVSGIYLLAWIVLRHIQQSFEVIATFEKKFNPIVFSEIASLVFIVATLIFFKELSFETILLFITISYLIRTLIVMIIFGKYFSFSSEIKFATLAASFTFMLLVFTNIGQSKTDMMVLNMLMDKTDLAKYGVITIFILLSRNITSFIVYPFVKNIYRLNKASMKLLSIEFLKYGFLITLAGVLFQFIMLHYFYHFQFPLTLYILTFICVLPSFWYTPIVFFLFKENKQSKVIFVNIFGILINVFASFIFIKPYGITGGLIAMAISQLFMLAMVYRYFFKSLEHEH